MRITTLSFAVAVGAMLLPASVAAEDGARSAYTVQITHDIVYGRAPVGFTQAKPSARDLLLDVYRPVDAGKFLASRPAIIMAFGGAFHRGSRGEARFEEDGAQDSSMADYCRSFARSGYVCFSIDYRLTPEDPGLLRPLDDKKLVPKAINLSPAALARIELVRESMKLPPLDDMTRDQYWRSIFAAAEDMAMATDFVRDHAAAYGVDSDRVALGGFSAGAITALNAAYGLGARVKAVVALSGAISGFNLFETVQADMPPALFFVGQNDLDGIRSGTRLAAQALGTKAVAAQIAWVPDFGHFYPMGAVSLGGNVTRTSVENRILDFLDANLAPDAKRGAAR